MSTAERLAPCPFCGSKASQRTEHDPDMVRWGYVACDKCGVRTRGSFGDLCPVAWQSIRDEWNRRSTPADGGGQGVTWREPGPVTPGHPLECLIVLPALRQFDGDWWACQKFFGESEPLGWLPDTPEIRAAIGTPASTGGSDA